MIKPGFSGFIVTGPSTAPVLAATAAGIASPVRYLPTAFNLLEELSLGDWLAEMFGLDGMKGIYSSGGSVANLLPLVARGSPGSRKSVGIRRVTGSIAR